jgi:hypothetical protein
MHRIPSPPAGKSAMKVLLICAAVFLFSLAASRPAGGKPRRSKLVLTVGPVDPGVYRYTYVVDDLLAIDTRNPDVSGSLNNVQSVFTVPGADFLAMKPDVPHGSVETVCYHSTTLGEMRRMHVYLPPGL